MRELLAHYRRKKFTHWLVCGLVGCGGGSATPTTVVVVPSTVADPAEPPLCDVDALTFSAPDAGAIRIRNEARVQCEVDVFESELADPLMEPNVWLDAGTEAEVLVEEADATCDAPLPITSIDLVVNGRAVEVPVSIPPTCGVLLSAIYQVDPAE
jgi:hypothetical protein